MATFFTKSRIQIMVDIHYYHLPWFLSLDRQYITRDDYSI